MLNVVFKMKRTVQRVFY